MSSITLFHSHIKTVFADHIGNGLANIQLKHFHSISNLVLVFPNDYALFLPIKYPDRYPFSTSLNVIAPPMVIMPLAAKNTDICSANLITTLLLINSLNLHFSENHHLHVTASPANLHIYWEIHVLFFLPQAPTNNTTSLTGAIVLSYSLSC